MMTNTSAAAYEQTARLAFDIWCENGRRPGTAEDDWRAAERRLQRQREHVALTDAQNAQDATD